MHDRHRLTWANKVAAANRHLAGQSGGSANLSEILAADPGIARGSH